MEFDLDDIENKLHSISIADNGMELKLKSGKLSIILETSHIDIRYKGNYIKSNSHERINGKRVLAARSIFEILDLIDDFTIINPYRFDTKFLAWEDSSFPIGSAKHKIFTCDYTFYDAHYKKIVSHLMPIDVILEDCTMYSLPNITVEVSHRFRLIGITKSDTVYTVDCVILDYHYYEQFSEQPSEVDAHHRQPSDVDAYNSEYEEDDEYYERPRKVDTRGFNYEKLLLRRFNTKVICVNDVFYYSDDYFTDLDLLFAKPTLPDNYLDIHYSNMYKDMNSFTRVKSARSNQPSEVDARKLST